MPRRRQPAARSLPGGADAGDWKPPCACLRKQQFDGPPGARAGFGPSPTNGPEQDGGGAASGAPESGAPPFAGRHGAAEPGQTNLRPAAPAEARPTRHAAQNANRQVCAARAARAKPEGDAQRTRAWAGQGPHQTRPPSLSLNDSGWRGFYPKHGQAPAARRGMRPAAARARCGRPDTKHWGWFARRTAHARPAFRTGSPQAPTSRRRLHAPRR